MNREFVPYEESLALKELGFDEECLKYWNDFGKTSTYMRFQLLNNIDDWWCQDYIKAPLYSQAFRWFREKYKLFHHTQSVDEFRQDVWWECVVYGKTENKRDIRCQPEETYEEAELACLKKLIQIVKNK